MFTLISHSTFIKYSPGSPRSPGLYWSRVITWPRCWPLIGHPGHQALISPRLSQDGALISSWSASKPRHSHSISSHIMLQINISILWSCLNLLWSEDEEKTTINQCREYFWAILIPIWYHLDLGTITHLSGCQNIFLIKTSAHRGQGHRSGGIWKWRHWDDARAAVGTWRLVKWRY